MKAIRVFSAIVILILLIGIIATACLLIFIDPNKLKPTIIAEVSKKTGYQLIMDKEMTWSFYPTFGIKTAHMQLKNPAENVPFIDVYDVSIATNFKQLFNTNNNLQGDVYIKQIHYMKLRAQQARFKLHWQNGVLTLNQLTAKLYNGTMTGLMHARNLSSTPAWDWNVQFQGIQIKELMEDLYGKTNRLKLSGISQAEMQGNTLGITRQQVMSNLSGILNFSVRDGILEGIDFNYFIQSADALINKQPLDQLANTNQTPFDSLIGSAQIKNGLADTDNLLLTSSAFSTKAAGRFDLINQSMNLQLQILPLHAAKIQWAIPLLISGDFNSPTVRLDMLKLQAMINQEALQKIKVKVQEKAKELPKKVDQFLKKFMND